MITTGTPLRTKTTPEQMANDLAAMIAYAVAHDASRPNDVVAYLTELAGICLVRDFNFRILGPQSYHECFNPNTEKAYDSFQFVTHLNPVGLGVFDDGSTAGIGFANGADAAKAHVAHMHAYVVGNTEIPVEWQRLDPRFSAVFQAGFAGKVKVLGDLGNGRWATDKNYATKIAAHANAIFKGSDSVALTFGNVVHPPYRSELIPDHENRAWNDLGQRRAVGVCQHSMVGSLAGTSGWFRRGSASNGLTDYGIGGSTDGPLDGVIIMWNDPLGRSHDVSYTDVQGRARSGRVSANRAGWANGGSDGLEGDGPLFVRTFGVNGINRDLVSIERSDGGNINTSVSDKQMQSMCAVTAYWFDQADVPYDRFPLNPAYGAVTHTLHFEFATKDCAFPPVNNRINEIQDRVRAILKAGQTLTDVGEPVPPVVPPEPDHDDWHPYSLRGLRSRYSTFPVTQADGTEQTSKWHDHGSIPNAWVARARAEGHTRAGTIPTPLRGFIARDKDGIEQMIVTFDGKGKDNWTLYRPAKEVAWRWLQ